ncbi:hypothetical protein D3C71_2211000 [compost metagenome]
MNRLLIPRVVSLQQRHQLPVGQVIGHGKGADTRHAGAQPGQLRQRFAAAAFDIPFNLQ